MSPVDHDQLEVPSEGGLDRRRMRQVGLDPVPEDPGDARERGAVGHHVAHRLVDALAGALHLLQEAAAALERRALVAQRRQPAGERRVPVAERRGVGDVRVHLALEARGRVARDHHPHHVVVALGALRVDLHPERVAAALDAVELLADLPLAVVDRRQRRPRTGDAALGIHRLLAQAVRRGACLLRGLGRAGAGVGGRHHGALGLRGRLGRGGDPLGGIVDLRGELADASVQLRQPRGVGIAVLGRLGQAALGHLGALRLLALEACGLDAALLQPVLGGKRRLARRFRRVVAVFQHRGGRGQLLPVTLQGGQLAGQARQLLALLVVGLEGDGRAQGAPARVEVPEAPRLLGLALHDLEAAFRGRQLLAHQHQVLLGVVELALRLHLAGAELRDARGLLQDPAALHRGRAQHGIDLALLDDRVGVVADAGVEEQLLDVAQADLAAVDEVLAAAVGMQAPGHLDLVGVDRQPAVAHGVAVDRRRPVRAFLVHRLVGRVHLGLQHRRGMCQRARLLLGGEHRVVEDQGHARHPAGLAGGAPGEDHVEHRAAAQALRAALAEHPLDGVHDVGLAAAVRADHADDRRVEPELGRVGKALESAQDEPGKAHVETSCQSLAPPLLGGAVISEQYLAAPSWHQVPSRWRRSRGRWRAGSWHPRRCGAGPRRCPRPRPRR